MVVTTGLLRKTTSNGDKDDEGEDNRKDKDDYDIDEFLGSLLLAEGAELDLFALNDVLLQIYFDPDVDAAQSAYGYREGLKELPAHESIVVELKDEEGYRLSELFEHESPHNWVVVSNLTC